MGQVDIYPPSQPSGMTLAYAEVTANQTGITTQVDLTGLAATVTVPAGRRIRITGYMPQVTRTAGTVTFAGLFILESAVQLNLQIIEMSNNTSGGIVSVVLTPSAGSHTYKLAANTDGTIRTDSTATTPAYILVEDITGTIYPAGTLVTAGIIASEPWTDFVPTLTQGVTVTYTIRYAKYIRLGRTIITNVSLLVTGGGTAGQPILLGLPTTVPGAGALSLRIGSGSVYDQSANLMYNGIAEVISSTEVRFWPSSTPQGNVLGAVEFSAALTSNDQIHLTATYEAVS